MSVSHMSQPSAGQARAGPRTGVAMAVIMTGVLMAAVEVAGYLIGGLACLVSFGIIERRQPEPMLPVSLFRVPACSVLSAFRAAR
jgi:hypothetical protein